ncbi:hypothetical protein B4Q13_21275, partial [Lacticaseibacillus rhamnosus]
MAMTATESPAFPDHLMEGVSRPEKLQSAWKHDQGNKRDPHVRGQAKRPSPPLSYRPAVTKTY